MFSQALSKYTPGVIKKMLSKLVTNERINKKGMILLLHPSAEVLLNSSISSKGSREHLLSHKAPRRAGRSEMALFCQWSYLQ